MNRRTLVTGMVKGITALGLTAGLTGAAVSQDMIKIGAVAPKTGPLAGGSTVTHWPNIEMWVQEVNARGGLKLKDGQKKTTTRKIYPGYMFVQMLVDNETWHVVTSTPKVTGFIGGSRNPPPMSEVEVGRIIDRAVEEESDAPKPVIHFERGEEIRIIDGPFATMVGRVEEVNQTRAKLTVMVNIFGRPTSVELDFTQVERLS